MEATENTRSSVVKSEHVVEAEEASRAAREEVEDLGELDCILAAVDEEVTGDETENAVVNGGLSVETLDLVLDVAERAELVDDRCDTLELFTLESQHGIVSVQLFELLEERESEIIVCLRVCWCQTRCSSAEQTASQC